MERTEKKQVGRVFYLDVLRVIACMSVVMIHVSAEFVVRGKSGPDFWLGNLLDSLSRAGVPLFVMISGALMLDENYEFTKKKWLGHIVRMVVFYPVWMIICRLVGSPDYHLWFVPMIVGVYLLVPLLRLWVNEMNIRYVEYFLVISAVFVFFLPQCLDMLRHAFGWINVLKTPVENMNMQYTAGYTAYFILGWYLNRSVKCEKVIRWLTIPGALLTFAGTGFASVILQLSDYPFYENFTINVLMYSASIFVLCRLYFPRTKNPGGWMPNLIGRIGKYSLGIYAVHLYVIMRWMGIFGDLHCAVAIPLIFVLTVVVSMLISIIFSKIPLLKKIV